MIDKAKLILELARGIVRANQSEYPDEPAEAWTEEALFTTGFYSDAESFLVTLEAMGLYVGERKKPLLQEVEAVEEALKKAFPRYERLKPREAATRLVNHLHETKCIVRQVLAVPAFANGGEKEQKEAQKKNVSLRR